MWVPAALGSCRNPASLGLCQTGAESRRGRRLGCRTVCRPGASDRLRPPPRLGPRIARYPWIVRALAWDRPYENQRSIGLSQVPPILRRYGKNIIGRSEGIPIAGSPSHTPRRRHVSGVSAEADGPVDWAEAHCRRAINARAGRVQIYPIVAWARWVRHVAKMLQKCRTLKSMSQKCRIAFGGQSLSLSCGSGYSIEA